MRRRRALVNSRKRKSQPPEKEAESGTVEARQPEEIGYGGAPNPPRRRRAPKAVTPDEFFLEKWNLVSLGETKKDKGTVNITVFVKFNDQKLVLGTLSLVKFPQISYDSILFLVDG
ncbi:hypothetical protein J5N97_009456 [Dioscorea zingiberensis]|uniref:Uncharacterized protein n=1 Tax=Dioscorea zingiberensis TaxID=325984 RepID=A0A9D5CWX5_9LILI|nr:hypothetical protein J5N97_009456 [Dioscorea zingiberensis]